MNLINIHNQGRIVYLFTRTDEGQLKVLKDESFYPFFYEPDPNGEYNGYGGVKLRRVHAQKPGDIAGMRSDRSFSADVRYPINYLTHKVDKITPCPLRYAFLDTEMLCTDLPNYKNPKDPISCITVYDSFLKDYKTFYIEDYLQGTDATLENKERLLLEKFMAYMKQRKFDLWFSWNVDFDYNYLFARYGYLFGVDFAKELSAIGQVRWANDEEMREMGIHYPAGMSICDYMKMFKKVSMREQNYTLDHIAQKHLGEQPWPKTDFSKLTPDIPDKNKNDIVRMVKIEEKFGIVNYYNEIRLTSKALWEDLCMNSRILDSVLLEEAKHRGIILPNKPKVDRTQEREDLFEGAYRRSDMGFYKNLQKADVVSMYPNQIINFCLDSTNIVMEKSKDTILINGYHFKQNSLALLPDITKIFLEKKDILKKELGKCAINTPEHKLMQTKYDAYKGLVNSVFGVMGCPSFRLYDERVASTITFLSRDLVHYEEDKLKSKGVEVKYIDTDALMYQSTEDMTQVLNNLVQDWAKEKYGKDSVTLTFDGEGMFEKILIFGKCNYVGYIKTKKGVKLEEKGIKYKRADSSKFESYFHKELIMKVLAEKSFDEILDWIELEKARIKSIPLEEIAFPAKVKDKYKNVPIFLKAIHNTQKLDPSFKINQGEPFFYIFYIPEPIAFTIHDKAFLDKHSIDWDELGRRSIYNKSKMVFEAMGWDESLLLTSCQEKLF